MTASPGIDVVLSLLVVTGLTHPISGEVMFARPKWLVLVHIPFQL